VYRRLRRRHAGPHPEGILSEERQALPKALAASLDASVFDDRSRLIDLKDSRFISTVDALEIHPVRPLHAPLRSSRTTLANLKLPSTSAPSGALHARLH
jgi:hypothetical protein